MTTAEKTVFTPEDLLALPESVNFELVNGVLVQRQIGSESGVIAMAIGAILFVFVRSRALGHVGGPEVSYQCFRNAPNKVRKPDVSFVRTGRLDAERIPKGHIPIPPDLAVEVLSPGDLAYEIDSKVQEYLTAGVKIVWVVNPQTRNVRIHRPRDAKLGPISTLSEADIISGEDVIPGFECAIAEFFKV